MMAMLIWIGAGLSLLGLVGILWSLVSVIRARRAGLDEDQLRARLGRILPVNLGALLLSVLGLMTVVVGIILSP
jgi:hypothetical protein